MEKSERLRVLFGRSPWDFSLQGVFFRFFRSSPLPLSYPRGDGDGDDGDRFPQNIYGTSPGGENSEDITVQGLQGPRLTTVPMSR